MKKLIIINGTMGVGKSSVCQEILKKLDKSVYLDGDWCWNMNPFVVTEETKAMVIDNITYLLRNYIKCSEYNNIIFCWVLHKESIFDDILNKLGDLDFETHKFTLICSPEELINRLNVDINLNIRSKDITKKSLDRLKLYQEMDTIKIDVCQTTSESAAIEIIKKVINVS